MTNKYYTLNFYKDYIELKINFIPEDNFNKTKLYFDLVLYYRIDNIIIRYKNKIINNEKELKYFFKNNSKIDLFKRFISFVKIFLKFLLFNI